MSSCVSAFIMAVRIEEGSLDRKTCIARALIAVMINDAGRATGVVCDHIRAPVQSCRLQFGRYGSDVAQTLIRGTQRDLEPLSCV